MNYLRDKSYNFSQAKQSSWKKPTGIVVIILIIYLWGSGIFVNTSSFFVYPYLKLSGQLDQNFSDFFNSQTTLLRENKKLKIDNESLQVKILQLENIEVENTRLRGLKDTGGVDSKAILGQVIIKPNHLPYDEIIIDLGKKQVSGLKSGQLVFADKKVILGQVDLVSDSYTKIKLYSTGGVKIPVVVGETVTPGIAEGLGAGNFSLTLPRGIDVKIGDQVKTSIVGSYILGYVANVYKNTNDPFQKVIFRSPYNIFDLEWVQLLP